MKTSLHSIKLEQYNLAGCNKCNSLHETNGKYENLNSIKSQLHYHHPTYYSCSYVLIMNTSWKQICTCKSHNIKHVWNWKLHIIISQLPHI